MTGSLKVTPSELESAANSFESAGKETDSLTRQMIELINGITGAVWSGEAATAYKNKFAGLQDDITKLNAMIKEHVDDLRAMAKEYTVAEEASKELANSLSSDIIL